MNKKQFAQVEALSVEISVLIASSFSRDDHQVIIAALGIVLGQQAAKVGRPEDLIPIAMEIARETAGVDRCGIR